MASEPEYVVDFPTLWVAADWVPRHCIIPDGFSKGKPLELADWQLWFWVNHYRVRPHAQLGQLSTAFHYRRSQVVMPQKAGKAPLTAAQICLEGVGPALFGGWADGGELWDCRDHGCGCGWVYEYQPGEPMGMSWPTPLVQITAYSEEQTANIYDALRPMIDDGPLAELVPRTGEEFIRLPNGGRIDTVTSSAQSRLGQRVTFVPQDETGIWTEANRMVRVAETQRRGLAGMGGRASEWTNAWDPNENSVAQRTASSTVTDIFSLHRQAPAHLSYRNREHRYRIHRHVYQGSWWVDLDAIEAEALELLEVDPAQAERFFGNRVVAGFSTWCDITKWNDRAEPRHISDGTAVVLGFDGSDIDDWTALRAETRDGYQFTPTYGPNNLPTIWDPARFGGQVPRAEVAAAVDEVFRRFVVVRLYADPPGWETEVDEWSSRYGEKRVLRFETYRPVQMHAATERLLTDIVKAESTFTHDGCPVTAAHVGNARKAARLGNRYLLTKASKPQKIDACVSSVICHEAAGDVTAANLWPTKTRRKVVVMS